MLWLCVINIQQPDTVWQNTLNYERDAIAQLKVCDYILIIIIIYFIIIKSIEALKGFPSLTTQSVLKDAIMNENFYYNVRIKAASVLSHVRKLQLKNNNDDNNVLGIVWFMYVW